MPFLKCGAQNTPNRTSLSHESGGHEYYSLFLLGPRYSLRLLAHSFSLSLRSHPGDEVQGVYSSCWQVAELGLALRSADRLPSHPSIHQLLKTYYVPGSVLGPEDEMTSTLIPFKIPTCLLCPGIHSLPGKLSVNRALCTHPHFSTFTL